MRIFALIALYITFTHSTNAQVFDFVDASTWRTGPLVSYTFSRSLDTSLPRSTNFTWTSQLEDRYGVATLDGINQAVNLQDFADDYGRFLPGNLPTDQSIEMSIQLLEFEPSTIFELSNDATQSIKLSVNHVIGSVIDLNTLVGSVLNNQSINQFSTVQCYGCANGSWAHIVMTVQTTSQSTNQGTINLYVNGLLVGSTISTLPTSGLLRSSQYIGRPSLTVNPSTNETIQYLNANVDSLFVFNYALSSEAIEAHAVLDVAPVFELDFHVDPRIRAGLNQATAAYMWQEQSQRPPPGLPEYADYHTGSLVINGVNNYVNLSALSTSASVATVLPATGGLRGAGARPVSRNGWSFEMVFVLNLPFEASIIDWAVSRTDNSNSILLSYSQDSELVFTVKNPTHPLLGKSIVCFANMDPGQWVHLVVSISSSGNAQCFIDGKLTMSATQFPLPAYVTRSSALIARSNSRTLGMAGMIDLIRVHESALSSDVIEALYDVYSPAPPSISEFIYQSGPLVQYQFDEARQLSGVSNSENNQYSWRALGLGAAAADTIVRSSVFADQSAGQSADLAVKHTGLAYLDQSLDTSTTRTSNQYINLNYDADSRGQTLPLYIDSSLSFEMWILIDRSVDTVDRLTIFDLADVATNAPTNQFINQLQLSVGAAGSLTFSWMDVNQVVNQLVARQSVQAFQWTHIAVTIQSINQITSQSNFTIHVDGMVQATRLGSSINRSMRRLAYLGKAISQSINQPNSQFIGYFDSFYLFNYALTSSQVGLHLAINQPPLLDASFERNPQSIANLNPTIDPFNYNWVGQQTANQSVRYGMLSFDGMTQFVDLSLNSGPSSIGEPLPVVGPIDQSTYQSATQMTTSKVMSIEASFNVQSMSSSNGASIFEFSNNGMIDMIQLRLIDGTVVFSINNAFVDAQLDVVVIRSVSINQWYHIALVVQSTNAATGQYSIYLNGGLVHQSTAVMLQAIHRNYASIAKSSHLIDSSLPPFIPQSGDALFNGLVDAVRIYQSALTASHVQMLANRQDWSIARPLIVVSSSSTGPAVVSSSSSSRSSSSSVPSSSSSSIVSSSIAPSSSVAPSSSPVSSTAPSSSVVSSTAQSSTAQSSSVVVPSSSSSASTSTPSSTIVSSSASSSSIRSSSSSSVSSSSVPTSVSSSVASSSAVPSSSSSSVVSSTSPSSSSVPSSSSSSSPVVVPSSVSSSSAQSSTALPSSSSSPIVSSTTVPSSSVPSSSSIRSSSSVQSSSVQSSSVSPTSSAQSSSSISSSATPSSSVPVVSSSSISSSAISSSAVSSSAPSSSAPSSSAQSSSSSVRSSSSSSASSSSAQSSSSVPSSSVPSSSTGVSSSSATTSSTGSSTAQSSSSVRSSSSSNVVSSSSSSRVTPVVPAGSATVRFLMTLATAPTEQLVNALQTDLAHTIATPRNLTTDAMRPYVTVLIGDISSANRRLLNTDYPVEFTLLGNVTNLGAINPSTAISNITSAISSGTANSLFSSAAALGAVVAAQTPITEMTPVPSSSGLSSSSVQSSSTGSVSSSSSVQSSSSSISAVSSSSRSSSSSVFTSLSSSAQSSSSSSASQSSSPSSSSVITAIPSSSSSNPSVTSSSSPIPSSSSSSSTDQSSSSVEQSQSSSSSTGESGVPPVFEDNTSSSSSLSTGSLAAAIVVPAVVGLCLLITAGLFFYKRSHNQSVKTSASADTAMKSKYDGAQAGNQVNYGYTYGSGADTTMDDDTTVQVVELERMPVD